MVTNMSTKAEPSNKLTTGIHWLTATAFCGAMNDNVFRWLMFGFLINIYDGKLTNPDILSMIGLVFAVPFLLFTALGGNWADRFSKQKIIAWTKISELIIMTLGTLAFLLETKIGVYSVLFLMCSQSAIFGPAKYAIIPELIDKTRLARANAQIEMATYLAIIIGQIVGLSLWKADSFLFSSIICISIAVIGIVVSRYIPKTAAVGIIKKPSIIFFADIITTMQQIKGLHKLRLVLCCAALFSLFAGFIQLNTIGFGEEILNMSTDNSGYLFILASLGIGLGSIIAGRMCGKSIEISLVPLGALGFSLSILFLGCISSDNSNMVHFLGLNISSNILLSCGSLALLGFFGGFYIVPLHTYVQYYAPKEKLGQTLAAMNFISWIGVLLAAGLNAYLNKNYSPATAFRIIGVVTVIAALFVATRQSINLLRFAVCSFMRLFYRIKSSGVTNVPTHTGALIICNHVTWLDGIFLTATQQRRIRFLMSRELTDLWWLKPFMNLVGIIPISEKDPPRKMLTSFRIAREALENGELVAIFPEGGVTRTGTMQKFKPGYKKIVKGSDVPIIPAYIGGAWGSLLSYRWGKMFSSIPKQYRYPLSIEFGNPLPNTIEPFPLRQAIRELSCNDFMPEKQMHKTLIHTFIRRARLYPLRPVMTDANSELNNIKLLAASFFMAKKISPKTAGQEKIGILLPSSCGGAIANLAISLLGKVPVNLNFTGNLESVQHAIDACDIKLILTSRLFIKKLEAFKSLDNLFYLEDLRKDIKPLEKPIAMLKALFLPTFAISTIRHLTATEVATIIFSSGSTGVPKGVMLSHHNILNNVRRMAECIRFKKTDVMLGFLPFFHSFGFMATIWMPLTNGFQITYIPNPLNVKDIAAAARKHKATLMIATPTFLAGYIRRISQEDFAHLRYVIVGAEKLKERVGKSFEEKFGLYPLEGYGATELSPVVSLNLPNVRIDGVRQIANYPGTVGHPIPGVAVKIVDPETFETLDVNTPGLLLIKGHNVMLGYLNDPNKTKEVIKDGWYHTGDIAKLDDYGFITITDRLSRFSKIGGEMVAHIAIEEVYANALKSPEQSVVVTAVLDEKKGELLIVLYISEAVNAELLAEIVAESNLPNLWRPKPDNYYPIEAIPVLGTGKLDLKKIKSIAVEIIETQKARRKNMG